MSDAAAPVAPAPAAPAAQTSTTPVSGSQNGAPKNVQKPAPTPTPKPNTTQAARANNGQFLPKDGSVGVVPAAKPAAKAEAEWRFKEKLNVYGEEEDVDLDRETLKRQLQKLRAYEKKHIPEFQQNDARARRLVELAGSDEKEFLRALGKDPDAWARQHLAESARLGAMTEEEKAIHERDREIAGLRAEKEERLGAEKKAQQAATHDRLVSQMKGVVGPAIEKLGLGSNHVVLGGLVDALKLKIDQPGVGLENVTADELAADTLAQMDKNADRYLASLDIPGLIGRLGEARVQGILEHTIAEHEKGQTFEPRQPERAAPPTPPKAREYLDEREVNRRLAELRGR